MFEYLDEPLIPERVVDYLFDHPEGDCLRRGARGIGYTNLPQKARVLAQRDSRNPRRYHLTQKQLIQFAVLHYCWTPASNLAYRLKLKPESFCRYVEKGLLGPTCYDLYDRLCLRMELKNNLVKTMAKYRAITKANKNSSGRRIPLAEGELSPQLIAIMIGDFTAKGVTYWCKKKGLASKFGRGGRIIAECDFLDFMERVLRGEIFVWHSTKKEFPRIIKILEHK